MDTRFLVLMRHGKSGYPGGVVDHDRPLTDRGRSDAHLAGEWLRENLPPVDQILSSTALRARQSADATGIDAPVLVTEDIYDSGADAILERIRTTDATVRTLLVVGHAPGVPSLAFELAGPDIDPAFEVHHFPTAGLAALQFSGAWADLGAGGAQLTSFHRPRA